MHPGTPLPLFVLGDKVHALLDGEMRIGVVTSRRLTLTKQPPENAQRTPLWRYTINFGDKKKADLSPSRERAESAISLAQNVARSLDLSD